MNALKTGREGTDPLAWAGESRAVASTTVPSRPTLSSVGQAGMPVPGRAEVAPPLSVRPGPSFYRGMKYGVAFVTLGFWLPLLGWLVSR